MAKTPAAVRDLLEKCLGAARATKAAEEEALLT